MAIQLPELDDERVTSILQALGYTPPGGALGPDESLAYGLGAAIATIQAHLDRDGENANRCAQRGYHDAYAEVFDEPCPCGEEGAGEEDTSGTP
jgi:hypothetical protein